MFLENDFYSTDEEYEDHENTCKLFSDKLVNYKTTEKVTLNREFGIIGDYVNILVINKSLEDFQDRTERKISTAHTPIYRHSIQNNIFGQKKKRKYFKKLRKLFKIKC